MRISEKIGVVIFGLFLITLPVTVWAASKQWSQSVYVAENEIVDGNFIRLGNIIDVAGTVNGDIIAVGNSITISGPVAGDVIVLANKIKITGSVGGSIRAIGSTIEINSKIQHNVWLAAGNISLGEDSAVGWDVYSGGGSVEIKGPVSGNAWLSGGGIIIGNEIGKNIVASINKDGQLILYPEANIKGNLTYYAVKKEQLVLKEGAKVLGQTKLEPLSPGGKKIFDAAYLFSRLVSLFGLLIVGLVIITFAPKKILTIGEEMVKRPWLAIGRGLIYFFITPALVILLLITLIGIPLALIIVPLYLIALYVSQVIAGFTLGLFLMNRISAKNYSGSLTWPLILGATLIVIVTSLNFFGWLIKLLLIWWALGALVQVKIEELKEYR